MSRRWLPLLAVPRALVPGTRAGLPVADRHLARGEQVVLLPPPTGRRESVHLRVATLARVEEVRPLGPEITLARLFGSSLVRPGRPRRRAGRRWVRPTDLAEPGPGAAGMIDGVERALRRYLALRAEAGEPIGNPPRLSRDPVVASHEVASRVRISGLEVQEILEAGTAADRLRRARAVLDREGDLLRRILGREGMQWPR